MVVSEDGCMNLRNELVSLNTRLEVEGCRLRIEQRGQRLNLRGPLPRRDGQQGFSMQRISLGLKADATGLQDAEQTLRLIQRQLERQRFAWSDWVEHRTQGVTTASTEIAIQGFRRGVLRGSPTPPVELRQPDDLDGGLSAVPASAQSSGERRAHSRSAAAGHPGQLCGRQPQSSAVLHRTLSPGEASGHRTAGGLATGIQWIRTAPGTISTPAK